MLFYIFHLPVEFYVCKVILFAVDNHISPTTLHFDEILFGLYVQASAFIRVCSPFIGNCPFKIKVDRTGLGFNSSQKGQGAACLVCSPFERDMSACGHEWDFVILHCFSFINVEINAGMRGCSD